MPKCQNLYHANGRGQLTGSHYVKGISTGFPSLQLTATMHIEYFAGTCKEWRTQEFYRKRTPGLIKRVNMYRWCGLAPQPPPSGPKGGGGLLWGQPDFMVNPALKFMWFFSHLGLEKEHPQSYVKDKRVQFSEFTAWVLWDPFFEVRSPYWQLNMQMSKQCTGIFLAIGEIYYFFCYYYYYFCKGGGWTGTLSLPFGVGPPTWLQRGKEKVVVLSRNERGAVLVSGNP